MKANTRGDSGLSDSGLQRTQKFYLKKHKDTLDIIEKCGTMEAERRRKLKKGAKPRETIWQTIKGWFNVK